ncbi:Uncharacterised protein [Mycobacteroides abscessus subsp. massiliense]|nr:Uncharacterised protein [Mycobacteroides abscessus subsp. massiliense]
MERTAGAVLAPDVFGDTVRDRRHVRRTEGFEEAGKAGGIGERPPVVVVRSESNTGCAGVAGPAQYRQPVESVEHPTAQAECL